MILYEWVYDRGKIAEGVFCSEKCAKDMYFDNPRTCYKGGPSALDEQESEELAVDWVVCYGCGKLLNPKTERRSEMSLFPERQAAVKVLYKAAGQLLDDVTENTCSAGRQLCQTRAMECIELAEKIAKMGPVKVTVDQRAIIGLEVKNIPFALGFVVKTTESEDDDLQKSGGSPDPDFEVPSDKG